MTMLGPVAITWLTTTKCSGLLPEEQHSECKILFLTLEQMYPMLVKDKKIKQKTESNIGQRMNHILFLQNFVVIFDLHNLVMGISHQKFV